MLQFLHNSKSEMEQITYKYGEDLCAWTHVLFWITLHIVGLYNFNKDETYIDSSSQWKAQGEGENQNFRL